MLHPDHPHHPELLTILQAIDELSAKLDRLDHARLSSAVYMKALDLLEQDEDHGKFNVALQRL